VKKKESSKQSVGLIARGTWEKKEKGGVVSNLRLYDSAGPAEEKRRTQKVYRPLRRTKEERERSKKGGGDDDRLCFDHLFTLAKARTTQRKGEDKGSLEGVISFWKKKREPLFSTFSISSLTAIAREKREKKEEAQMLEHTAGKGQDLARIAFFSFLEMFD